MIDGKKLKRRVEEWQRRKMVNLLLLKSSAERAIHEKALPEYGCKLLEALISIVEEQGKVIDTSDPEKLVGMYIEEKRRKPRPKKSTPSPPDGGVR